MSTELHVPSRQSVRSIYVGAFKIDPSDEGREDAEAFFGAEFDRFIAKIKADALREWSGLVQMELAASASHGIDLGENFLHGAHSMLRQAGEFADRIEEEA